MNPLASTMATFAVSTIFIVWQHYRQRLDRKEHTLRQRVAFLLWTAAHHDEYQLQ